MSTNTPHGFTPDEHVAIMFITPQIAEQWLAHNVANRKLREASVAKHVEKLQSGLYQFNGDAIRWSTSGRIIDGQHRLTAIVRTGIPMKSVVVWGIRDEAQVTMDRGDKRSLIDHLSIMGEDSTKILATVLSLSVQWFQQGRRFDLGLRGGVEYEDAYAYLKNNPNVRSSVALISDTPKVRKIFNPAHLAFVHWVTSNIDPADADDFVDRLISGRHDYDDDPVWRLRERMKDLREERADRIFDVIPMTFKAWNLYRDGVPVKFLRVRRGGSSPERFPEPH